MRLNNFLLLAALFSFSLELRGESYKESKKLIDDYEVVLRKEADGFSLLSKESGSIVSLAENSMVEDFAIHKSGGRFSVLREGRGVSKDKTLIKFDGDFMIFDYIYIDSQIDVLEGRRLWGGFRCSSKGYRLLNGRHDFFDKVFNGLCGGKPINSNYSHEFLGVDAVFYMPLITQGGGKEIKIIALDAGLHDNVNIFDFGCLEGCDLVGDELNYTGRIGGSKIKMSLRVDDGMASGYYYYDRFKKNIAVDGVFGAERVSLFAKNKAGVIVEKIEGRLEGGIFSGMWIDVVKDRRLPFIFYLSII
ncbi:hypothetical protein [Pseudomonas tohonis]|uniref:hypothetical protein n=1 Tax=Pseudomonas tohonis TaxID=2725477 RepID=UPI00255B872C|nr:hypothetical protein [Pseudomonas tohonis]